jgi:hypothetical protein
MKRAGMADGYIALALGRIESVRMARQHQEPRPARGVHDGGVRPRVRPTGQLAKIGRMKLVINATSAMRW